MYTDKPVIRNRFKGPEGRYQLQNERNIGTIPFTYHRNTRLSLATLTGGNEEGTWIIANIGDYIHILRLSNIDKDPARSLSFLNATKFGFPTCHAHTNTKDGVDLLVGMGDGEVYLLSLRAQLSSSSSSSKPTIAATIPAPKAADDVAPAADTFRVAAVHWVPKTDGTQFVVAFASGNINVYKKSTIIGEGSSRFSLGISSKKDNHHPIHSYQVSGTGITDAAPSPDGTKLAVTCLDGALRILDLHSGSTVAGFQSYFGKMLCCSWGPDGKHVAAGGEDDMVAVYGVAEKCVLAYGEGHKSWVSRVYFDPWLGAAPARVSQSIVDIAAATRIHRVVSGGQDAQLCLWDMQLDMDGIMALPQQQMGTSLKRVPSTPHMPAHSRTLSADAAENGRARQATGSTTSTPIAPAPSRAEMNIFMPIMEHRVHPEPISDICFTQQCILTADYSGCIRMWSRPSNTTDRKFSAHDGEL